MSAIVPTNTTTTQSVPTDVEGHVVWHTLHRCQPSNVTRMVMGIRDEILFYADDFDATWSHDPLTWMTEHLSCEIFYCCGLLQEMNRCILKRCRADPQRASDVAAIESVSAVLGAGFMHLFQLQYGASEGDDRHHPSDAERPQPLSHMGLSKPVRDRHPDHPRWEALREFISQRHNVDVWPFVATWKDVWTTVDPASWPMWRSECRVVVDELVARGQRVVLSDDESDCSDDW